MQAPAGLAHHLRYLRFQGAAIGGRAFPRLIMFLPCTSPWYVRPIKFCCVPMLTSSLVCNADENGYRPKRFLYVCKK